MKLKRDRLITVEYPCHIAVQGPARKIAIVCPYHRTAHPGEIKVKHNL